MTTPTSSPPSRPPATKPSSTAVARVGLILALGGLAILISGLVMSLALLFFSPLIMCGITVVVLPISLGAIILGWKGRREQPTLAWAAILVGLALPPTALALLWYFGTLIGQATA